MIDIKKVLIVFLSFFLFFKAYSEETEVISLVLAKSVKNRIPDTIGDVIPNNIGRVYLWTQIKANNPPTYIYHVWYYKNKEVARIRLYIKYPVFRTWSFKTVPPTWTGSWKVVVEDVYGNRLAEKSFKVVNAEEGDELRTD